MTRKYLFVFLLLMPNIFFAQIAASANDKIIYLDSLWNPVTNGDFKYYRIVKDYHLDKEEYRFEDHFATGKIQMEGNSITKDNLSPIGDFVYYFENGNKKFTYFYRKGQPMGKAVEWYENGNKKAEREYTQDDEEHTSEYKTLQFWNEKNVQTVVDGNGELGDSDEHSSESGKIKDGEKDGVWNGKSTRFKSSYTEFYESGKLKSGTSIDSLSKEHKYNKVFVQPRPKNGLNDFYGYIARKFRIPASARGISGRIYLQFIIKEDGSIEKVKVLRSAGYGLDEEAIRLISEYPDWSSGEIRGIKAKVLYSIPITIKA
ncbi:TonB family protein [Flavobacterium sp. UBA7680]|uniref:TonB family protein n=1 Tax=Flavobacterium sp. UBA7680 TaxID=1946559 RepID=UPI0025BC9A71|nr:TonB family protein [Flavobacterium sp. UBA7680]